MTIWLTRLLLLALLLVPLPLLAQEKTVNSTIIGNALLTNTTSATAAVINRPRTFYGQVVCTSGACTQTQAIYGSINTTAANGILLCTITLSATTRAQDACPVMTTVYPFYYVTTTNTTGTAATGTIVVFY